MALGSEPMIMITWIRLSIGMVTLSIKKWPYPCRYDHEILLAKANRMLSGLLFEGTFGLLHDCGESGSVNDGEISKDFTVELNVSGL